MPASASPRPKRVWAVLLPLVLTAVYVRLQLGHAEGDAARGAAPSTPAAVGNACTFPGEGAAARRLVVVIVDSLRDETALDARIMPWLARHREHALWGHMRPCLSQLSLLCFRTMFEGSEPLLVTAFDNFSGMRVGAPSLVHRLAARGVRVAAVADQAFISLYLPSLARHATFEERTPVTLSRDAFAHRQTLEWLDDPSLSVIVSHTIDTDATAHRVGVGAPDYVAKFRETDDFLATLDARLRASDSLLVLGDHGHDAHGYHSTGIPSRTAYFASGPWFPRGVQLDVDMATAYFFMGAVTCEPTPGRYTGQQPFDALAWPRETGDAFRRASPPPAAAPGAQRGSLGLDLPALLAGIGLFAAVVAGAGVASRRRAATLAAAALAAGLAGGLLSPWLLVTLQNHVNPQWTIGFWSAVAAGIVGVGWLVRRWLGFPTGPSVGLTAWGVLLFALFLGPYYYGAIRCVLFGTAWAAAAFVARAAREERAPLVRWLLLGVLPTLPVLFPVLKEWQPQWVLLRFVEGRGPLVAAACAAALVALAVLASPERHVWQRPVAGLTALLAIGSATQVPSSALVGAALVLVAYVAWMRLATRLAEGEPPARVLVPIGQASFALAILFVLLGGYRFASVDFRFALAFTPVEAGEARAAALAVPLCILKYLAPVGLLLAVGPPVDWRAAAFVLLKLLVLGAGLLGMQLVDSPRLVLFRQLQGQELAITVLVYAVVAVAYLCRPAPPPPGAPGGLTPGAAA